MKSAARLMLIVSPAVFTIGLLSIWPQRSLADDRADARRADAVVKAPAAAATTRPAGPTRVRVGIEMAVHKEYGFVAHLVGKSDVTIVDKPYAPDRNWWDNPMIVFEDPGFSNSCVAARADAAPIQGQGKSSNVSVDLKLVPHADLMLQTLANSDCVKGVLTVTISTQSEYYDGGWTKLAAVQNRDLVFTFDTSDKSKPLHPTTMETRTVPSFSFERYTRDHAKWDARSTWPADPKSGDWRCTISGKDAKVTLTGYDYAPHPAAASAGN